MSAYLDVVWVMSGVMDTVYFTLFHAWMASRVFMWVDTGLLSTMNICKFAFE